MYKTITLNNFIDEFRDCGRKDKFSNEGLEALFNYIEELEAEDPANELELDVIALCCDFTEMDMEEMKNYYRNQWEEVIEEEDDDKEESELEDKFILKLQDETQVIEVDKISWDTEGTKIYSKSYIIQNF